MNKDSNKWLPNAQKLVQLQRLKDNQTLYQVDDRVSWEEVCLMKQLSPLVLRGLFPSTKAKDVFEVEYICQECGSLCHHKMSKSALCGDINKFLCIKCAECRQRQEKRERQKRHEQATKRRNKCWDEMLSLIDPDTSWDKQLNPYEYFARLYRCYSGLAYDDKQSLNEKIRDLSYDDFLRTPYWRAVSAHVRYLGGHRCALCSQKRHLAVHHKTYEHHGCEIEFLEDLILLCDDCHRKFHEIGEWKCPELSE